jgi:hypothetical protein
MNWINTISSNETKGDYTMKRVCHLAITAQRGREHIREDDQQAIPIYNAIAQALRDGDVLRIAHNDFAYETDVLWLLRHLPATANRNDVEELLKQRFTERQNSPQYDPDDVLHMQAIADDLWRAWSQYLHRHEQSPVSPSHSRVRGLMSRHYYSRTNNR